MHRHESLTLLALTLVAPFLAVPALATDSTQVKALMAAPPREYATAPLWVWNDMLTEEQVRNSLRELAAQNVKQAFVHPRPGLMTPYLSRDWFHLWRAALDEAERLDMNIWIYDENSYPSGFAGGWVPELMPESRGRALTLTEYKAGEDMPADIVGIYRVTGDSIKPVNPASDAQAGDLIASVRRAGNDPWHGNRCYVDLMYPGVTEKFLDVMLEAYRQNLGDQFGKRILGSFTDEPELTPAGRMPWTPDLPEVFQQRWGYSLVDNLPSLYREVGDWKRVRHNYYAVLNQLFIERWAKPYHDWCERNGIEFTGHYWEHAWPDTISVPDNMAMYAWHQRPAIDCLMNQYNEGVHGQFGNARAVRELASVANQLGRPRTLCEAYGAGGWDLRFEDMKRIGDWLYVLGVNTLDEHLSYITIRGARKRDHPQSFSYHEPWWQDYHALATYWARLSAVMSSGEQVNHILLIEPTTTAWMYNGGGTDQQLGALGDAFQKLVMDFEAAQVEYDIGCEDIIARHGSVEGKTLVVGKRDYTTVVIPPHTENLDSKTIDLLERYANAGGSVLAYSVPSCVDGRPSDRAAQQNQTNWNQRRQGTPMPPEQFLPFLARLDIPHRVDRSEGDKGILFHHRRQFADGEILFLVNTSIEHPSSGTIGGDWKGAEAWDLETGEMRPFPVTQVDLVLEKNETPPSTMIHYMQSFELPPCGSLLLFFPKDAPEVAMKRTENATTIHPSGDVKIKPVEPNVLTLDYVDITAAGETKRDIYFYAAGQFAFQRNGMPRNPWDSAVQYKDELINHVFAANSGFEASYKFTIAERVPQPLYLVLERPDLYTVECNRRPIKPLKDQWWLDRAFGKFDISAEAQVGENVVTIKATPFTIFHELESAYVLGEFQLRPVEKGFVIAPAEPLKLGAWNEQGWPMYASGVTYTETFDVASIAGEYRVSLAAETAAASAGSPDSQAGNTVSPPLPRGGSGGSEGQQSPPRAWYGSVARVKVNGKDCGRIFHAPWECDVTAAMQTGKNTVEVTVVGTLKNTLGPHHGNPGLGSAWPGMFHQGPEHGPPPGKDYATVGYGLFAPFMIKQVR